MKVNQEIFDKWLIEDKEYLSLNLSIIENLSKFSAADFEFEELENIKNLPKELDFNKIENNNSQNIKTDEENKENKENKNADSNNDQNIILKNKIICLNEDLINLRSLCLECKIHLLMSGESYFYIFSRCKDTNFCDSTAVCCISKELESARKFVSFSVLEPKEGGGYCIKTLKKQEIPHQDKYIKSLDISEINFIFIDNGDNRCFVFLIGQEQNSNMFLIGDFYEPIEWKSNVMFAVNGDLISLKKLVIKQRPRNSYVNYRNNGTNDTVQSCTCCNIF